MLATAKYGLIALLFLLATLNVVQATCRVTKHEGSIFEYCCSCIDKGWFGECHSTHSNTCSGNRKFNGEHSCPTGEWGCYSDDNHPFV
ncbi:hypothetical protein V8B55DRAFT_1480012 [Mucor lusitanicus]|uniref:CBM1 domain-containing protein n=1 Tax=Mucor circinelloides f. lusitanicus TaxID=29924 RepID=A0A8H4BHJ3_MUCCL|nr:hypothetical protein FB192DRAFT_1378073 [Mucor lusitanicus]